jgi:hypothetical protein
MKKRYFLPIVAVGIATYLAVPGTSQASAIKPDAPALSNHLFVEQFTPATLGDSAWTNPSNDPGNCPANPGAVSHTSSVVELKTTGNDCTSIQSPHEYPTRDWYVYEANIYFSNFKNTWPAYWLYGNVWPNDGEMDALEINNATNCVTWHYGASNSQVSTCENSLTPTAPNITPGTWNTVDVAFGGNRIQIFYNGKLYVTIPETLTGTTDDPMWITASESGCDADGSNECASGNSNGPGNVQIKDIRIFDKTGH